MLDSVFDADAELFSAAEVVFNIIRAVFERCADICYAVPAQQQNDVLHHRPAAQRHKRLRHVAGYGLEPPPFAACHDNCLHKPSLLKSIVAAAA